LIQEASLLNLQPDQNIVLFSMLLSQRTNIIVSTHLQNQ